MQQVLDVCALRPPVTRGLSLHGLPTLIRLTEVAERRVRAARVKGCARTYHCGTADLVRMQVLERGADAEPTDGRLDGGSYGNCTKHRSVR